jgi:hypothetical protein
MIERYTIKFGPAVSQKELEKALNEANTPLDEYAKKLHQMHARIEIVGDFEDVKKIRDVIENLKKAA